MEHILIVGIFTLITVFGYFLYRDAEIRKNQFKTQMKMAEAQASMSKQLSFKDCYDILNNYIQHITVSEVTALGLFNMTSDQLSVVMSDTLSSICVEIDSAMSEELKRQLSLYSSDIYIKKYILDQARTIMIASIETRKKTHKK